MATFWRSVSRAFSGLNNEPAFSRKHREQGGEGQGARLGKRSKGRRSIARAVSKVVEALEERRLMAVLPASTVISRADAAAWDNEDFFSAPVVTYNPLNPQQMVAVFVANRDQSANGDQRVFVEGRYSTNGGASWDSFTLPSNMEDPAVADDDTLYTRATDPSAEFD